jgi:hypothetical protein
MRAARLPAVTLAVEWDNARDVERVWVERHLAALQAELLRSAPLCAAVPTVSYLYDPEQVDPAEIERNLSAHAPKLRDCARVELVPVPGADYLGLKTAGILRAATEIVALLDCDTAPQPGWLARLLVEFVDPKVVLVGGFTTMHCEGFSSRVAALAWIFQLPSEVRAPAAKTPIHANNFALRAEYFRAHPWSAPAGGKKGIASYLREIERNGRRWVRAVDARNLHAPQRSVGFFVWRGWLAGFDQDWVARQKLGASRLRRAGHAWRRYRRSVWRGIGRVVTKHREVELPSWQVPAALAVAFAHWTATFASQLACAVGLTRGR